eukprot:TRINITY_DN3626_c3_g1_i1.p1 TRINITY_DN3626_c3_g1~~TRINITY_DN3626_c3_g1_i1.p1  ORF type:complete len:637 (+),score=107.38 TRINITY_DN3626_c3_g1_i1:68-1912(+)
MSPSLRQNLCAALDDKTIIYLNVSDDQQTLWTVSHGDFSNQTKQSFSSCDWEEDVITSISVSSKGNYLFIRGMQTGYVSTIKKGTHPSISEPQQLYQTGGIIESHWHPTCENILYCLSDYRRVAVFNVTDGQLHGLINLGTEDAESIVAATVVANSRKRLSSLAICSANTAGLLTVDFPIVPPNSAIDAEILTGLDPAMSDIIMCALDTEDTSAGLLNTNPIDPSCNSIIAAPCTSVIAVVEDTVLGLSAQHIPAFNDGFTIIVVTMSEVLHYLVPNASLSLTSTPSGIGELLSTTNLMTLYESIPNYPWSPNRVTDQCRVSFDNGNRAATNTILINHPLGVLSVDKKSTDGAVKMCQLHENAPAIGEGKQLITGIAQFTEADRSEQQYVLLGSEGEFVIDFVDASGACPQIEPRYSFNSANSQNQTIMSDVVEWAQNEDQSCLHKDLRNQLHQNVRRVTSTTPGDASLHGLLPLMDLRADATGSLNSALEVLQGSLRQKVAELKKLKQELKEIDESQKSLIASKEQSFKTRIDEMLTNARAGRYCNPDRLSSAISRVLVSELSFVSRIRIISDSGKLQQLTSELGISCPPELISPLGWMESCWECQTNRGCLK